MSKFDFCPMQEVQPGVFRVCNCKRLQALEEQVAWLTAWLSPEIGVIDDPTTIPVSTPDPAGPDTPAA